MTIRLTLLVLICLLPAGARAKCNGRPDPRWSIHQELVLLLNPTGAEHHVQFGLCVPLYPSEDEVLSENHFEGGVMAYNAPIYAIGGGYLQIAPASFLILRAELAGLTIWPLPVDRAGYQPRTSYDESWEPEVLAPEGGQANGWNARFFALLRGRIDLSSTLSLIALSALWLDYFELGDAPFYVEMRNDVLTAQSDWVFANESVLLLSASVPGGPEVRFGAYAALRNVPAAGYVSSQLGPIVMLGWAQPDPRVAALDIFVRFGIYTTHRFRTGEATTLAGISVDWDLGGL